MGLPVVGHECGRYRGLIGPCVFPGVERLDPVPSPLFPHRCKVMVLLLFLWHFWSWTVHRPHADRLPAPTETELLRALSKWVLWLDFSYPHAYGRLWRFLPWGCSSGLVLLELRGGDVARVLGSSAAT